MKGAALKVMLIAIATLFVQAAAAALFIESGIYNIGADDHHTKLTLAVIEQLRERSIAVRDDAIPPQAQTIQAGAARYAALCAGCHLAPGMTKSDIRPGLYPHPPNLAQGEVQDPQRAFWIIKHGIKMTAMPAWGKTLDDAAIWDLVAFVRAMPSLTPESYRHGIEYTTLVAGISDKDDAARKLPMLQSFVAFPTTIFIDRKGTVRKIHTGYSGPATGDH